MLETQLVDPKLTITLSVNRELYARYVAYCREEGLIKSRQFEKFIERLLNGVDK